jgi:hypothetical protein
MGFVITNDESKNSSLEETVNPKITKYPFVTQCKIPSSIVVNKRDWRQFKNISQSTIVSRLTFQRKEGEYSSNRFMEELCWIVKNCCFWIFSHIHNVRLKQWKNKNKLMTFKEIVDQSIDTLLLFENILLKERAFESWEMDRLVILNQ